MNEAQTVAKPTGPELTIRSIVVGLVVAVVIGSAYPYCVLKLGFGPNLSVVSAFFGFIALVLILRATNTNPRENNIVQTMGTSAGQTAFMCVLLDRFAGRQTIRIGQVLFIDIVTAHGHCQQNAQQAGAAEPEENLPGAEMNRRIQHALRIQQIERGQQDAHESCLAGAGAHGLHDVVFTRVGAGGAQDQHQRNEAKERRDYRQVWPKPQFQDAVGISAANDDCDDQSDYDRSGG